VTDPSRSLVRREDELWQKLSDRDRETLENGAEKQQKKDAEVMERWRRVHGPSKYVTAGNVAQCKAKSLRPGSPAIRSNTERRGSAPARSIARRLVCGVS
jgi:hypothetical protein